MKSPVKIRSITLLGETVTRKHVLKAIDLIDANGTSPRESIRTSAVTYQDRLYPAKALLARAWEQASGEELDRERFSGGAQTEGLLERLGFKIRRIA